MLKVFSYGGGVQSRAALVLASQGKIDYRTFVFSNVGADSEHPETLADVREIARPFAMRHDLAFYELEWVRRNGSVETIYGEITRAGSRFIGIPVYMSSGAPGNRSCTLDYKVLACDRWLKVQGSKHSCSTSKRCASHRRGAHQCQKSRLMKWAWQIRPGVFLVPWRS